MAPIIAMNKSPKVLINKLNIFSDAMLVSIILILLNTSIKDATLINTHTKNNIELIRLMCADNIPILANLSFSHFALHYTIILYQNL